MTLSKPKPKRPTPAHQQRRGQHHPHNRQYLKSYWPYLPVALILLGGFVANALLGSNHHDVLGYATDMSVSSLVDDTNAQRQANSEANLSLNETLNRAAQAKADDMAARDYWSHNTPDGRTPWTFMTAAGYTYKTAGENLAYGFDTAAYTLQGWMNSPEHKANILNNAYTEIGFGIANIANYQSNGPETLVVAMYGSPATVPAPPPPAAPVRPAVIQPAAPAIPTPVPAAEPIVPAPTPAVQPIVQPTNPALTTAQPVTEALPTKKVVEPAAQSVSRWQLVAATAPVGTSAVAFIGILALVFVVVRHSFAWRKVLVRGERFFLHHPIMDIAAALLISFALVFSHTIGLTR